MSPKEEDIYQRCLLKERRAQKELFDLYKDRMYTLSIRICGNEMDAADVMQEGFLAVFQNLSSFRKDASLGTWIHTIIARKAIQKVKKEFHFESINEEFHGKVDWTEVEDWSHLDQAIDELPAGYRSIFTLYEIEGFKHKEIAEMLSVSENTSKSQLFKAKKMLQEKLKVYRF